MNGNVNSKHFYHYFNRLTDYISRES